MKDLDIILRDIGIEVTRAMSLYPPFHSAHEGFAIFDEERDELWEEVKLNPKLRSRERLYAEAVQCAAMAVRFAREVAS